MIKETLLVSTFGLLGLVTVACGSQKERPDGGSCIGNSLVLGRV